MIGAGSGEVHGGKEEGNMVGQIPLWHLGRFKAVFCPVSTTTPSQAAWTNCITPLTACVPGTHVCPNIHHLILVKHQPPLFACGCLEGILFSPSLGLVFPSLNKRVESINPKAASTDHFMGWFMHSTNQLSWKTLAGLKTWGNSPERGKTNHPRLNRTRSADQSIHITLGL